MVQSRKIRNRVKIYALSADWTGSCQFDEKRELAVYILHPAETHVNQNSFDFFNGVFLLDSFSVG